MTPRLSGHFSISGFGFFVLKPFLEIAIKWSRKKFAILAMLEFYGTERRLFFSTHGAPLWALRARESSY